MIAAVRMMVPWALLAVFLVCAFRWRIFLLGIPFLMFMGESVFFDTMKVFSIPGRLERPVLLLLWLLAVWALATGRLSQGHAGVNRQGPSAERRLPLEDLLILAFGALVIGHIAVGAVRTGDFAGAAGKGLGMLSVVVGYFLIRDIVAHASRREVVAFLGAVVLSNAIATALFIMHQGLQAGIYTGAANATTVFGGQVITRAFTFAPPFVLLTTAFVLARRRWTLGWGLVLLVTLVGVWGLADAVTTHDSRRGTAARAPCAADQEPFGRPRPETIAGHPLCGHCVGVGLCDHLPRPVRLLWGTSCRASGQPHVSGRQFPHDPRAVLQVDHGHPHPRRLGFRRRLFFADRRTVGLPGRNVGC